MKDILHPIDIYIYIYIYIAAKIKYIYIPVDSRDLNGISMASAI